VNGLILLLATALVSGLLAPWVVDRIQTRNQRRLKVFESDLTRQSRIIDEQGAMIQRLSGLLWEFQLSLIAPLYYGQPGLRRYSVRDRPASPTAAPEATVQPYEDAVRTYLANSSRMLGAIRAEIGGAVRLVPLDQWTNLKDLYYQELLRLDLEVTQLILGGPTEENAALWQRTQSHVLRDLAMALDETIDGLAGALGLKHREDVMPGSPDR